MKRDVVLPRPRAKYFIRFGAYLSAITRSYGGRPTTPRCATAGPVEAGRVATNGIHGADAELDKKVLFFFFARSLCTLVGVSFG